MRLAPDGPAGQRQSSKWFSVTAIFSQAHTATQIICFFGRQTLTPRKFFKNSRAEPLHLFKMLRHCLPPIHQILTPPNDTPPEAWTFASTVFILEKLMPLLSQQWQKD
jgi:hypothetical protein